MTLTRRFSAYRTQASLRLSAYAEGILQMAGKWLEGAAGLGNSRRI